MIQELKRSAIFLALITIICGGLYPLAITGVAQLAAHPNGDPTVIGQTFTQDKYFHGRPKERLDIPGAPADLVTPSASGLDPHISPASAEFQVTRVAKARKMDPVALQELIKANTQGKWLGVFGMPRVNVLKLNQALDTIN